VQSPPSKVSSDAMTEGSTNETIKTFGEVFSDGSQINPVRTKGGRPGLMLSGGTAPVVADRIEHRGRHYELQDWNPLESVTLPTCSIPHGSTRDLLQESTDFFHHYGGVDDKTAALMGRFQLASALIDAMPVAPAVMIFGLDRERATRLRMLLGHVCRHPMPLTNLSPNDFRGLPSGGRFTIVMRDPDPSNRMYQKLEGLRSRDSWILTAGRLLSLFGAQVIHTDDPPDGRWSRSVLQVCLSSPGTQQPPLDPGFGKRVTEIQNKLLSFRNQQLCAATRLNIDTSRICPPLRDLAHSLCAATPDDAQLQEEVFELLGEHDEEVRSEAWVSLDAVIVEAIIVANSVRPGSAPSVAELANWAGEILLRRGATSTIDPAVMGKRLKTHGFRTKRDSRGARLLLSPDVVQRANRLLIEFGIQTDAQR
jgi:hypothetical protein